MSDQITHKNLDDVTSHKIFIQECDGVKTTTNQDVAKFSIKEMNLFNFDSFESIENVKTSQESKSGILDHVESSAFDGCYSQAYIADNTLFSNKLIEKSMLDLKNKSKKKLNSNLSKFGFSNKKIKKFQELIDEKKKNQDAYSMSRNLLRFMQSDSALHEQKSGVCFKTLNYTTSFEKKEAIKDINQYESMKDIKIEVPSLNIKAVESKKRSTSIKTQVELRAQPRVKKKTKNIFKREYSPAVEAKFNVKLPLEMPIQSMLKKINKEKKKIKKKSSYKMPLMRPIDSNKDINIILKKRMSSVTEKKSEALPTHSPTKNIEVETLTAPLKVQKIQFSQIPKRRSLKKADVKRLIKGQVLKDPKKTPDHRLLRIGTPDVKMIDIRRKECVSTCKNIQESLIGARAPQMINSGLQKFLEQSVQSQTEMDFDTNNDQISEERISDSYSPTKIREIKIKKVLIQENSPKKMCFRRKAQSKLFDIPRSKSSISKLAHGHPYFAQCEHQSKGDLKLLSAVGMQPSCHTLDNNTFLRCSKEIIDTISSCRGSCVRKNNHNKFKVARRVIKKYADRKVNNQSIVNRKVLDRLKQWSGTSYMNEFREDYSGLATELSQFNH
ncbi:unnamed protein product [Moneuplotes crassus]|uniref:Uncharacterized protein n=1 Tax=Euplotes crassus TaxID=5936 RepID=A0AAD1Y8F2_EUPCR|nr:unnamed protein product [Moneuplotes crassus]